MTQYGQTTVSVDVENLSVHYTGNMDGIVLSELFYNGGTYGGTMMHPDQYIVIANNSDREINVSGLALARLRILNTLPCSDLTSLLPDYVVAANIYQIPAGQNYTLAPGEVYVIASQAQNHTESYTPNPEKTPAFRSTFSGADFELADNDAAMSGSAVDNPKVPNLTKITNSMPGGIRHGCILMVSVRCSCSTPAVSSGVRSRARTGLPTTTVRKRMPPFRNIRVTRFLRT